MIIICFCFSIMEISPGIYDFRLENDSTMIVSGPSKGGKSMLVIDMIKNKDNLFRHPIRKVWWFYGISSPFHDILKKENVILKEGLPSHDDLESIQQYDMVVLDDLQQESKSNEDVTSLFLKASHHKGYFAIQINQYLFGEKDQRMRNANVHYYVAFNNPRNQQSTGLFLSKMLPKGNINLIYRIFNNILAQNGKFGYLFVDFTSTCEPNMRLRTNLFKRPMIVFKLNLQNKHYAKMDYSEMVVIPKAEYEQSSQKGGMNPMQEAERVNTLMQPEQSYIQGLAKRIVHDKPTMDNINNYNLRLAMFDNIRRRYFAIPNRDQQEDMKQKLAALSHPPPQPPSKPRKLISTPSPRKTPMRDRLRTVIKKPGRLTPQGMKKYLSPSPIIKPRRHAVTPIQYQYETPTAKKRRYDY